MEQVEIDAAEGVHLDLSHAVRLRQPSCFEDRNSGSHSLPHALLYAGASFKRAFRQASPSRAQPDARQKSPCAAHARVKSRSICAHPARKASLGSGGSSSASTSLSSIPSAANPISSATELFVLMLSSNRA